MPDSPARQKQHASVQAAIAACEACHGYSLNLSGLQLQTLPEVLQQLPDTLALDRITTLNLSNNQFTELPDLRSLTALNKLDISGNAIQTSAHNVAISEWQKIPYARLETLNLSHCGLVSITGLLSQASELQDLNLSGNQLNLQQQNQWFAELQSWLNTTPDVQKLWLSDMGLTAFELQPSAEYSSYWLSVLDLSHNAIQDASRVWRFAPNALDLSHNELSTLSLSRSNTNQVSGVPAKEVVVGEIQTEENGITNLSMSEAAYQIRQIDLSHNRLIQAPEICSQLNVLERLDLSHNQLVAWPECVDKPVRYGASQRLDLSHNPIRFTSAMLDNLQTTPIVKVAGCPEPDETILNYPHGFYWPERQSWRMAAYGTQMNLSALQLTELPSNLFRASAIESLNVNNNLLTQLPDSIGQLKNLKSLSCVKNQLAALPVSLVQLPQLNNIDLNENDLTHLPVVLGQLPVLQSLQVANNRLQYIDSHMFANSELVTLNLSGNQLSSMPMRLSGLAQLETLYLDNNRFTHWPDCLNDLPKLVVLHLANNQLTQLPISWWANCQLTHLNVAANQITVIPKTIEQLSQLQSLQLNNNQIQSFPEAIFRCEKLGRLNLSDNQLSTVPEQGWREWSQLTDVDLADNQLTNLPEAWIELGARCCFDVQDNPLADIPEGERIGEALIKQLRQQYGRVWPGQAVFDAAEREGWDTYCGFIPKHDLGAWPLWIDSRDVYYDAINGYIGFSGENDNQCLQDVHPYYYPIAIACEACELQHGRTTEPHVFYVVDMRDAEAPVLQWKRGRGFFKLTDSVGQFAYDLVPYEVVHEGMTLEQYRAKRRGADDWCEEDVKEQSAESIAVADDAPRSPDNAADNATDSDDEEVELDPHGYWMPGRLNRVRYVIYMIYTTLVGGVMWQMCLGVRDWFYTQPPDGFTFWTLPALIYTLLFFGLHAGRRLQDMGLSTWWSMVSIIPGANFLLMLVLAVWPGQKAVNEHGDPAPTMASPLFTVGAFIVLVVLLFGMTQCNA